MEELLELKNLLLEGNVQDAISLVEELEEMSRDDKINRISSYAVVLLIHLLKQQVENRSTRSWEISIRNALRAIQKTNKRRKAGGYYLSPEEVLLALEEAYPSAIDAASLEVEEGRYDSETLAQRVDRAQLLQQALDLILDFSTHDY